MILSDAPLTTRNEFDWRNRRVAALLILATLSAAAAGCTSPSPPPAQEDIGPDGMLIATTAGAGVLLRHAETGAPVRTLAGGHDAPVLAVHFSASGDRLVSGDQAGRIVVWNPSDGSVVATLLGHRGAVRAFATRAGVPDLASGSDDGTVRLWDLGTAKEVRALPGHAGPVYGLTLAPDGRTLASASGDRTVRLWDVETGSVLRTLAGHAAAVRAADFDGGGTRLATGDDGGEIKLWDLKAGTELRSMKAAKGPVLNVFLTRNGRWILAYQSYRDPSSGTTANPLSIWNASTGEIEVSDYLFEAAVEPPDWPFRAVYREVADRVAHRPR